MLEPVERRIVDALASGPRTGEVAQLSDAILQHPMGGFAHGGEFLAALRVARENPAGTDRRLVAFGAATTFAGEDSGPTGGWAVPSGVAAPIVQAIMGPGTLLGSMNVTPVDRLTPIPVDQGSAWGTTGVQAAPTAEGAATSPSVVALAQMTPTLFKATTLVHASEELMGDTPASFEALAGILGRQLRGVVERWLLLGTGMNEPTGILNAPALIAPAGTGAGTLTTTHLGACAGRLIPDPGTFIVAGPSATGALRKIEMDGGRLPFPVITSMEAPAVGTKGDATFVAPSGFAVHVRRGSFTPQATIYFMFDQFLHSLRAWVRIGCVPLLAAAVAPKLDTANTVSHCVTTATRT